MDWNGYEEWPAGVSQYDIEIFNDLTQLWQPAFTVPGALEEWLDEISNLDQPIYCYRLYGNQNGGSCRSPFEHRLCARGPGVVLLAPNAFTPNGDGLNELFELKGHFIADYHFMLWDRWGQDDLRVL
ncbi:MAG: gliding motility-associated C-terminal domain-containing protein [Bacteroidia bacterium]